MVFLAIATLVMAVQSAASTAPAPCTTALSELRAGRDDAALDAADACERAVGPQGDPALRADVEWTRGNVAIRRGLLQEAIRHHEREVELAKAARNNTRLSRAYSRLSALMINLGDAAKMFEYAQRAYELIPTPTDRDRMNYLYRIGQAYADYHDVARADAAFAEMYRIAKAIDDRYSLGVVLNVWALLYVQNGADYDRAWRYYNEGLAAVDGRTDVDSQQVKAILLTNSANLWRDDPRTVQAAIGRYAEAIAIERQTRGTDQLPFGLKNMGRALRVAGHADRAEPYVREAIQLADETGVTRIRWQARLELGRLLWTADPPVAEDALRECLDILEAEHSNVLLENYRPGALAGELSWYDNPYHLLIGFLLEQHRDDDAFIVAERARARVLLDMLSSAREAFARSVPVEYQRSERNLLRQISDRQAKLRSRDLAASERERITAEVRAAEDRLAQARIVLASEHPELAHARYPKLWSMADLRARLLADDEALLEYLVGADRSVLWIVRKDGATSVPLPPRAEIEAAARPFIAALSSPDSDVDGPGRALATILLPDADARLQGIRRLRVVPDGILHYVPFEALPVHDRFLVESRIVSYVPSAATLAFLRSRPPMAEGTVVAIGNPTLGSGEPGSRRGAALGRIGYLTSLPFTARELDAVAAAYRGASILQRDSATEDALSRRDLTRAAIVHFATHGVMDEEAPQRSGLILSIGGGNDGILQAREIYALKLHATLVTLSACQTALGSVVTGEGMLGLARAFMFAGARSVMASLWNINDESTASFMARFYRSLREGRTIDDAAQSAKLAFIAAGGRLRHPYYWAPFVVTGDAAAPVRVTEFRGHLALLAALVAGALAAAAVRVR